MNNIICIAGPTASGKTALAVELAKEFNGEVVSCDSMQVYRRMDIGTAKPTAEEIQGIVHHMIDVAEPWEDFSVSKYCAMATPIVDDIISRGKTAVIAGGTGLYMDSLIKGNDFAPFPSTGMRESWKPRQMPRAWNPCWRCFGPSIPMLLPNSTCPTGNGSSGRWRSGMKQVRPSPPTI